MRSIRWPLALVVIAVLISSCAAPTPTGVPSGPTPAPVPSGVSAERWSAILADLAGRGVRNDRVELVSAGQQTWPDGALGCPEPGRVYTQALVDGWQVVVRVDTTTYDYRFGNSATPLLCRR